MPDQEQSAVKNGERVIGQDIKKFYASEAEYQCFLEKLLANDALGFPTLGYAVNIKTSKGQERVFEINSQTVKDRKGKIIGRTGVIRDITNEKKLREDMQHLQSDIGRVLHSYTATLLMVKHTLSATAASLGPEPYTTEQSPSMEEIGSAIAEPAKRLAKTLGNFLQACEGDWHARGLQAEHWQVLAGLLSQLQSYTDMIQLPEFRPPALRLMARKLLEVLDVVSKGKLPRELARRVQEHRQYSGNSLEPVFSAMRVTLRGGNTDTHTETAGVLQRILVRLQRSNHSNSPDMLAALKELQRIGELALQLESEMAALAAYDEK